MRHLSVFALSLVLLSGCSEGTDDIKSQPSEKFIGFTDQLLDQDLVPDHQRVHSKELYDLNRQEVRYFDKRPFYRIDRTKSSLYGNTTSGNEVVGEVKSIWAYFYREKETSPVIYDGVIEQWEFPDDKMAHRALPYLRKAGEAVFFNTTPYFCRHENSVYVFHTRAAIFSDDQKSIFEKFLKKTEAYVEN